MPRGMKARCRPPATARAAPCSMCPASNERALAKIAVARLRRGDPRPRGRGRAGREGRGARKARRFHEAARRRRAGNRHPHQSARQRMGRRRPAARRRAANPTASCCPRSTRRATYLEAGDVLDDNFAAGRDQALGDDRDAEGDPQPRRHRRAWPRPGLAACLFRRRHQRSRQGDRHPASRRTGAISCRCWCRWWWRRAPAGWSCSTASSTISAMPSAFARECEEAAAMGFDGKTLIHPDQIEPANKAFAPDAEAMAEARAIVAAFALAGKCRQGRDRARWAHGRAAASRPRPKRCWPRQR